MSFIIDHVHFVDSQIDQLQLPELSAASDSALASVTNADSDRTRIIQLQLLIKSLSTASASRVLLKSATIQNVLQQARLVHSTATAAAPEQLQELEWLLVSKSTVQTYGLILNALLEQIISLSRDIKYWDEVLSSYTRTGLYSVQVSPRCFWRWATDIYLDTCQKFQAIQTGEVHPQTSSSISDRWTQFYGLVKKSVRERSLANMQSKITSPFAVSRTEVRRKQSHLKRLREMSASGLGVLLDEGLTFDMDDEVFTTSKNHTAEDKEEWRSVVSKSVVLMETVLRNVTLLELGANEFEDTVFTSLDDDPEIVQHGSAEQPSESARLASRLQHLLCNYLPRHVENSRKIVKEHGRPSRIVRYWLPTVLLIFSSTTLLRILFIRKAEIMTWVRDLVSTAKDFWYNWILEPLKKVIGTIRHDEDSEVALMSKRSLEGDRNSLERMVVDFAQDTSSNNVGLNDEEIADLRAKVKEGDLTPVLKAYEKDLRRPFIGTIRGELIRALLIQIQKTKVDVDIAVGGIDALLKSQELVFGFVGLTPGILVCLGISHWLRGFLGGRNDSTNFRKQGQVMESLRNIHRILSASTPSANGMLSYKEHGLLLCQVHVLRQAAQQVLPGQINVEFLEELNDLMDLRAGVERQLRVVDRIRWAYSKWLRL
ncbi:Nuclear control of ATPase protein 2 [Pseudocyphellaria aurata]|nr:Nuclear control of ATPase protein 2 [Pseudocyphellaria aurata]